MNRGSAKLTTFLDKVFVFIVLNADNSTRDSKVEMQLLSKIS